MSLEESNQTAEVVEETTPESVETAEEVQVEPEETKLDFWNPDTWGDLPREEVVKKIQTHYNEKATKAKTLEKDLQAIQEEYSNYIAQTNAALEDPRIYEKYRQERGYITQPSEKAPTLDFSKMETKDDVINSFNQMKNYFENKITEIERSAETKAEQKIRQAVDPISRERWSVALGKMKDKYGEHWGMVEKQVATAISRGQYKYTPGQEKEVLDKAFRAECPSQYEAHLRDSLKTRATEKSKATTVTPRKTVPRTPTQGGSIQDRVLAKVHERVGPLK